MTKSLGNDKKKKNTVKYFTTLQHFFFFFFQKTRNSEQPARCIVLYIIIYTYYCVPRACLTDGEATKRNGTRSREPRSFPEDNGDSCGLHHAIPRLLFYNNKLLYYVMYTIRSPSNYVGTQ